MTILNDFGDFFKRAGNSIYNSVVLPIGNGISKAYDFVFDKAINPVGNLLKTTISSGEKIIAGTSDALVTVEKAAGNAATGLGSFLGSPLSYLAIGGVALIVLPKLL